MILAIDPGGKSGVAVRFDDGSFKTCICESLFNKNTKLRFDATELYEMVTLPGITHVVIETFQAQTIDKYGLHTVRLVGAVEALCWHLKIPLTKHMPTDRKPFQSDAKQLLMGTRAMIHEHDALAHLLRYEYDISKRA